MLMGRFGRLFRMLTCSVALLTWFISPHIYKQVVSHIARTVPSKPGETLPPTEGAVIARDDQQFVYRDKGSAPAGLHSFEDERVEWNYSGILTLDTFYKFVSRLHVRCQTSRRLGNEKDGGWNICLDGPYRPGPNCTVYSFGINYDWSFDDAISEEFNCHVKSFDPSMTGVDDHQRSKLVDFFKTGLSHVNVNTALGWRMETMSTILARLGDNEIIIDYLKLDIEYSEWGALRSMVFPENNMLQRVKQLGFEVHTREMIVNGKSSVQDLDHYMRVLDRLEQLGFRKWYFHENPIGKLPWKPKDHSCCYELVYINTHFMEKNYINIIQSYRGAHSITSGH